MIHVCSAQLMFLHIESVCMQAQDGRFLFQERLQLVQCTHDGFARR